MASPSSSSLPSAVTPQMVSAGVRAYLALDRDFDAFERIVSDVYQAMEAARCAFTRRRMSAISSVSHWWHP